MKARMLLVVILLLAVSTSAFCGLNWLPCSAANCNAGGCRGVAAVAPTFQLLTGTGVGIPVGTGTANWANMTYTPVMIFQDRNGNGAPGWIPDDTTNNCGTPVVNGCLNNAMVVVGNLSTGAGKFRYSSALTSGNLICPDVLRYYFVVTYPRWELPEASYGRIQWVSDVITPCCTAAGGSAGADNTPVPNQSGWHSRIIPPACTPTAPNYVEYAVDHTPATYTDRNTCVTFCNPGQSFTVWVGPVVAPNRIPTVVATPGCVDCGNPNCTPGAGIDAVEGWGNVDRLGVAAPAHHAWYYHKTFTYTGTGQGCFCIKFESILAAEVSNVAAQAGDGEVKVSWKSLSESNLQGYKVLRNDGVESALITAKNEAAGAEYSYTGSAVNGTTYTYTIRMINMDGTTQDVGTVSATPSADNAIVTEYALRQNYPNPFNPSTRIAFDVKDNNVVTLKIYNATGQEVSTLLNNEAKAGGKRYVVTFDASNLPSGLYFYSVKIGNDFSSTKKMLLVK